MHPAQATDQTAAVLDAIANGATLEVPALWPLEVANALVVLVRRRKLAEDERQAAVGWLRGLRVRVDQETSPLAFSRLTELAVMHRLSVYDAAYLELAVRRQLVLGCKDGDLARSSQARGGSPLGLIGVNAAASPAAAAGAILPLRVNGCGHLSPR